MLVFSDLRHTNDILHTQIVRAEGVLAKVKVDKRLVGATASIVHKYRFFTPNRAAQLAATHTEGAVQVKEQQKAEEMRAAMQLAHSHTETHTPSHSPTHAHHTHVHINAEGYQV